MTASASPSLRASASSRPRCRLGLPVKVHAEQLSNCGAARLAARHGALSADHLEHLDEAGAAALREAGTVAVLLPGAFYFLRETTLPPLDLLRRHAVPIALASDLNPGSSPTGSLLLMLSMACTLLRMSVAEALAGVTRHAARALGQAHRHGDPRSRPAGGLRGVEHRIAGRARLLVRAQSVRVRRTRGAHRASGGSVRGP